MNRDEKRNFEKESRKHLKNFRRTNSTLFSLLHEHANKVDGRVIPQYSAIEMLENMIKLFFGGDQKYKFLC